MPPPRAVDVLATADPLGAFEVAQAQDRLLALRTSGTAGRSRTVVRTPRSWVESFSHVSELLRLGSAGRVWVPGPLTATMNLFAVAHTAWAGAERVDRPRSATHAHLTPAVVRRELAMRPEDLAGMHVVVAGDRLDRPTYEAARAAGVRVSHYYGAAELSFVAWGEHAEALRPFPGVEVEARDGELWVRSPYLCEGYLEADLEPRRDGQGWMTVGDRGQVTDGLVAVHGRAGGITTGGATVLVADVEQVLYGHAIGEVVVLGVPHPDLGEVVAAVVSRLEDVETLRSASLDLLSPAQRPRRWVHLDPLPLTENGKVDRTAVQALLTRETLR